MYFGHMVVSPILYKMSHFRSSKILGTRVFWRLHNQTLDGHISGLVHHRDKLKPLLPTKLPTPYRLAPVPCMSRDHTTSGLAFLAPRSSKTVGKAVMVVYTVVGHGHAGGQMGARTGGHGVARVDSDHAECGGVSNRIKDSVL